jgi:16S rRNA (guanine527-N7)-methyltransferase
MTINQTEFLQQALLANGLDISLATQEQMLHYLHLMREWNRVFNLTSIRDPKEMIILHLLDSLSIHAHLHGKNIIDVGTGAGLPGIPLALTNPTHHFVLLDCNHKKTRFLNQVIYDLKINNVEVVHARAEDYHKQQFDSILSRAFSSLKVMLLGTSHLIRETGQFLAMKGTYPEHEIQEIPAEFKLINVYKLTIKELNAERHLVCMEKNTDGKNNCDS